MQQEGRILGPVARGDNAMPTTGTALIEQSIKRRTCINAVYNKAPVLIAPHILYTRHGDPFIDGVVVEREGKPPKEIKLGTFKVAGLTTPSISLRTFVPEPSFDRNTEKYAGNTIIAVSRLGSARLGQTI